MNLLKISAFFNSYSISICISQTTFAFSDLSLNNPQPYNVDGAKFQAIANTEKHSPNIKLIGNSHSNKLFICDARKTRSRIDGL